MIDPLTGADVGRVIPRTGGYLAAMPWTDDVAVQGGRHGLVVTPTRGDSVPSAAGSGPVGTYFTAFVEVFTGGTFIRGEGATLAAAERQAWNRYQAWRSCPGPTGQHEWSPDRHLPGGRSIRYRNGAGFCRHCGAFESGRFTGADLGQHCRGCGVPTIWHWEEHPDGAVTFLCRDCKPPEPPAGSAVPRTNRA